MQKKPVRKLLVACITGALFLPNTGFTLGLGDIEVNSALNQELKAEIELLSSAPEDTEALIVKLASREEFTRAGLDRPFMLNDLRFKTIVIDNVPHIQVSTVKPVREPFLNFLIEVDWPKGHLLREYTILLDPPTFMTQSQSAPVQSAPESNAAFRPAARPAVVSAPVTNRSYSSNLTPRAVVNPAPVRQNTGNSGGRYRIQSGDTAWSLAAAMRPDNSITVEQMMMALLQANPESFINENINGLKRGYILRTPDRATITAISPAQARAMVKEQAALWREYRQTHTGDSPASAVNQYENTSSAAETAGAPATDKGAHLKIVSAGSGTSTSGQKDPTAMSASELREALAIAREKLETERVEKELLHEEIEMLESQVGRMKSLLAIEGGELAAVQGLNQEAGMEPGVESDQQPVESLTDAQAGDTGDELIADEASDAADTESGMDESAETVPEGDAADQVFVDESGDVAGDATEMAEEDASPAVQPVPAPVDIVSREPADPLTRLLNDPMLLAGAGGGLLLILALAYLIAKRRKAAASSDESSPESDKASAASGTSSLEDIADMVEEDQKDEAATASIEKAEVDTESTMIMEAVDTSEDTVITDAFDDIVEEEEEPRDDVIAEADVYLAYGIYQQAEDLLENAIKENPERDDYRLKLAETRYASKNQDGFIDVAKELKERHPEEGSNTWKKVAAMGLDLCPDNALFQGSTVDDVDVETLAPQSPEPMDFDLGDDELEIDDLDVPDLDLSLDDDSEALSDDDNTAVLDIGEAATDDEDEEEVIDISTDELEFDLSETEAASEAELEEEFSLDIDASELDIDDEVTADSVPDAAEEAVSDEAGTTSNVEDTESTMQIDSDELGLDLDTDITAEEETADISSIADEIQDGNLDIDFAVDDSSVDSSADTGDEPADETEMAIDISADDDSLDIDFGVDDSGTDALESDDKVDTPDSAAAEMPVESAISDEESTPASADTSAIDDDEFDLSSLDDVDEISTKLDLARAYLDMGDSEGTREILKEVLADGSDEQKQEAEELMNQLDT